MYIPFNTHRVQHKCMDTNLNELPSCLTVKEVQLVAAIGQYTRTPLQKQDTLTLCSLSPNLLSQCMVCRIHVNEQAVTLKVLLAI
jgi:hypothetical protein